MSANSTGFAIQKPPDLTAIGVDRELLAIQSWAATGSARQTLQTKQENVMTQHTALLSETQTADAMLRARARLVVPGGMWGHLNAARLPEGYPQFFASAEGCRVRDVDGREYIDFMCSWGPILLGHRHPQVQAAAEAQAAKGDCFNGPGEVMVELAEDLVAMLPHADWAMFQKNGGDATTCCVTIARAGTGRRKVLVARGSYHGALPWCSPSVAGVTAEDRAHLLHFEYNDVAEPAGGRRGGGQGSRCDPGDGVPPRHGTRSRTANEGIRGSRACGMRRG